MSFNPCISILILFRISLTFQRTLHNDLVSKEFVLNGQTSKQKIVLLDCSYYGQEYRNFLNEHIPGAKHFGIDQVVKASKTNRRNPIHPLAFENYARKLGIDRDCHVIVYDHGESDDSIKVASYVWWLFKLYGHTNVSVMNGGLNTWKSAPPSLYRISSGPTTSAKYGNFKAAWDPSWLITYPDVISSFISNEYLFVDSRSNRNQVLGIEKKATAKSSGRIRGAINIPTKSLLRNGSMKNLTDLGLLMRRYGIFGDKPVITYCNTGVQASAMMLAMRLLGFDAILYNGSWVEFSHLAPDIFKVVGPRPV